MSRQPARCGTTAGARRHASNNEKPCNACARAKAEYDARWRNGTQTQRRNRLHAQAQKRALQALSKRYADEYRALYQSAKADLLEAHGGVS